MGAPLPDTVAQLPSRTLNWYADRKALAKQKTQIRDQQLPPYLRACSNTADQPIGIEIARHGATIRRLVVRNGPATEVTVPAPSRARPCVGVTALRQVRSIIA